MNITGSGGHCSAYWDQLGNHYNDPNESLKNGSSSSGGVEKAVPSGIRVKPLGSGGQLEMGSELKPRCQVELLSLTETGNKGQGLAGGESSNMVRMQNLRGPWDMGETHPVASGSMSRWPGERSGPD